MKGFLYLIFIVFFPVPFSPRIPSSPPQSPHCVHVHQSFFLFAQSFHPQPPSPLAVICAPSVGLSPFSLLAQFVHWIPHVSEIIWRLSLSDWLISLSIMFSMSIHTVAKGKIFFFFWPNSIPLCKCPIVVVSTHLLMETWAASLSW